MGGLDPDNTERHASLRPWYCLYGETRPNRPEDALLSRDQQYWEHSENGTVSVMPRDDTTSYSKWFFQNFAY